MKSANNNNISKHPYQRCVPSTAMEVLLPKEGEGFPSSEMMKPTKYGPLKNTAGLSCGSPAVQFSPEMDKVLRLENGKCQQAALAKSPNLKARMGIGIN